MKTIILSCIISAGAMAGMAQTNENPVKVRIKKIENINGEVRTTDTTYFINDPHKSGDEMALIVVESGDNVEISSDGRNSNKIVKRIVIEDNKVIEETDGDRRMIEELEKEHKVSVGILNKNTDSTSDCMKKIFILENEGSEDKATNKRKVLIITKVRITELTDNDHQTIKNAGIESKKMLETGELVLFPNPGNGKFRLSFNLQEKGDAEIKIISIEGKTVYEEKLKQFAGKYEREINIGESPKGVYFLSIAQGDKRELKKIVLE